MQGIAIQQLTEEAWRRIHCGQDAGDEWSDDVRCCSGRSSFSRIAGLPAVTRGEEEKLLLDVGGEERQVQDLGPMGLGEVAGGPVSSRRKLRG